MDEVSPGNTLAAAFETAAPGRPRRPRRHRGDAARQGAAAQSARGRGRADRRAARRRPRSSAGSRSIAVAGPGFINLHLRAAARQRVVAEVLDARRRRSAEAGRAATPVMVEFVSANPTGPLHVGHARQAALGDAICNLLETQGRKVVREFYYNDAGVQIATLARLGRRRGSTAWRRATPAGPSLPTTATTSPTSPPTSRPARRSAPTTGSSPRPAGATTSTASASSRSPTCATSRTSTCRRSACASTTTTSSRACTRAAGSRRPSPGSSPPARPTRRAARSGCAPPTTATTRTA